MNYSIGDKVEVKPKGCTRKEKDGSLIERVWQLWLIEKLPMKSDMLDQIWAAKFTRVSHSTLIQESWITRKISSNFKDFNLQKRGL